MDNQFFVVNSKYGIDDKIPWSKIKSYLNNGFEIKRCYINDNAFIFHIDAIESEEEAMPDMVVESVIEVSLTDDPETVKAYTDDGWIVRDYYSKRVQLIKYRATPVEVVEEEAEEMP